MALCGSLEEHPYLCRSSFFTYALPEVLGFSLSPFAAGVAALGINSTAYISEIVRGGINAIPDGQWEAAYVLGVLNPSRSCEGLFCPKCFASLCQV